MSALTLLLMILGVWLLLWGDLSAANVLSGLAVGVGLLVVFPTSGTFVPRLFPRPLGVLRFVFHFFWKLLESNVVLSLGILSRRSRLSSGVIAIPMEGCSDGVITAVANVTGLTPGTMAVEVTRDPPVLYVHILQLADVEEARAEVEHLRDLTRQAFGEIQQGAGRGQRPPLDVGGGET